ncbi:hypothetical protein AVEN_165978-1 [Araneus ventricosus]|uniref:Uncharacterized protein n=1 Tax=Araneus ventricosus TaxID=182803 RepID=A0A4Y2IFD6_ARAVE|nr:hypothetical protein AVEN_165978-1 [Araneus ventricosus]
MIHLAGHVPSAYPDSNFSLQQGCNNLALQVCKLAGSLILQECKFETSFSKRRSHRTSNFQQAYRVKLIANYSKNRECRQTLDSNTRQLLPNHSTSGTSIAEHRLR